MMVKRTSIVGDRKCSAATKIPQCPLHSWLSTTIDPVVAGKATFSSDMGESQDGILRTVRIPRKDYPFFNIPEKAALFWELNWTCTSYPIISADVVLMNKQ